MFDASFDSCSAQNERTESRLHQRNGSRRVMRMHRERNAGGENAVSSRVNIFISPLNAHLMLLYSRSAKLDPFKHEAQNK